MAATAQQFIKETSVLLKRLYSRHHCSRADYKSACEALAVKKMPRATEADRARFVQFALVCFDTMARSGLDPNEPVTEVGRRLSEKHRRKIIVPGFN